MTTNHQSPDTTWLDDAAEQGNRNVTVALAFRISTYTIRWIKNWAYGMTRTALTVLCGAGLRRSWNLGGTRERRQPMAYRKRTLRSMSPVARKLARLLGELDSVVRRGKGIVAEIAILECDSRALHNHTCQSDESAEDILI